MRKPAARLLCGLGLAAGVLLHVPAAVSAQVVPPPAGDIPIPPAPPPDSVRPDTIKPPIGRASAPRPPAIGGPYVWEGDAILASGAYTLTDLLARIPEITTFRSGWIHSPQYAAIAGDVTRIRLFLDDIELDAIDPRELGVHELGRRPIWSLQRVAIERAGTEIRVDMRTWAVQGTNPFTRTDVYTGTEETDLYRGYYGKRFGNGAVLQFAGEQGGTESARFGGGGDHASLLGRIGIGRRYWSLDVFAERRRHNRLEQTGDGVPSLAAHDANHTVAYARAAIGSAVRGPYLELLASTQSTRESNGIVPGDSVDTIASRAQYVGTVGWRAGPLNLSATNRLRRLEGVNENAFSARGEFITSWLEATARGETGGDRRTIDGTVRLTPLSFISVLASGSRRTSDVPGETATVNALRIEGGLSLTGIWLYGGALSVDAAPVLHPLDPAGALPNELDPVPTRRTARYLGLRGRGWRGLGADTYVIRWEDPGLYVAEYQARTEINFETQWLRKFPRGQFGFRIAVADEFRSGINFAGQRVGASHALWGLMEIRIMRATMTLHVRNPLGKEYFIVPGFEMPRGLSTYGVRWYFFG